MCVDSIEMTPRPSSAKQMPDRMRKGYTSIWLEKHHATDVKGSTQAHLGQASIICLWSQNQLLEIDASMIDI